MCYQESQKTPQQQNQSAEHNSCTRRAASQRGATIIEYTITLPFFLLIIVILSWVGVVANARSSLTYALSTAVRLAATRGDAGLMGREMIPAIDTWKGGAADSSVVGLFANPPVFGSPDHYFPTFYDDSVSATFGQDIPILRNLPHEHLYALAYLSQSLRLGIGDSVRFPCDPNDPGNDGCVGCRFVSPCQFVPCSVPPPTGFELASLGIAIECSMRPAFPLNNLINALFRIVSGGSYSGVVITRSKFFPRQVE